MLLVLPGFAAAGSPNSPQSPASCSPRSGRRCWACILLFARLQLRGDPRQLNDAYRLLSKFLAAIMLPAATGLFLRCRIWSCSSADNMPTPSRRRAS